jgi:hypothetical protein
MNCRCQAPPIALALGFVPLALAACGDAGPSGSASSVRDSAGIRIVENPVTDGDTCVVSPEPTLDLGLVDGPAEYQFYRVFDAATLSDGRIAVLDQGSGQIRIFSAEGAFEIAFGGEGGGPGEFRRVFQLWVMAGDTLVVGDYRPWRFSIFTPEGVFVRAVVPDPVYPNVPNSMTPLADGTFVLSEECCPFTVEAGEWADLRLDLVHHAADGAMIDTLAVLPHGHQGWLDAEIRFMGGFVFEATSRVAGGEGRLVVGTALEREIRVFDMVPGQTKEAAARESRIDFSRPTGLVRWTGPDLTITAEHVAAYRRSELERAAEYELPQVRRAAEALVSEDRPIANRFPSHAGLEIGLEGDIWVHEYPRPAEDDPGWLVFDAEGRFECRASLPLEAGDLYEIGPDYILGKAEDELEVEHVRRHALTRPGG